MPGKVHKAESRVREGRDVKKPSTFEVSQREFLRALIAFTRAGEQKDVFELPMIYTPHSLVCPTWHRVRRLQVKSQFVSSGWHPAQQHVHMSRMEMELEH